MFKQLSYEDHLETLKTSKDISAIQQAITSLNKVSADSDIQHHIIQQGCISILVDYLTNAKAQQFLQPLAQLVYRLCQHRNVAVMLSNSERLNYLCQQLIDKKNHITTRASIAGILWYTLFYSDNDDSYHSWIDSNALSALFQLLVGEEEALRKTASAFIASASQQRNRISWLIDAGIVSHIAIFLTDPNKAVVESSVTTLFHLYEYNKKIITTNNIAIALAELHKYTRLESAEIQDKLSTLRKITAKKKQRHPEQEKPECCLPSWAEHKEFSLPYSEYQIEVCSDEEINEATERWLSNKTDIGDHTITQSIALQSYAKLAAIIKLKPALFMAKYALCYYLLDRQPLFEHMSDLRVVAVIKFLIHYGVELHPPFLDKFCAPFSEEHSNKYGNNFITAADYLPIMRAIKFAIYDKRNDALCFFLDNPEDCIVNTKPMLLRGLMLHLISKVLQPKSTEQRRYFDILSILVGILQKHGISKYILSNKLCLSFSDVAYFCLINQDNFKFYITPEEVISKIIAKDNVDLLSLLIEKEADLSSVFGRSCGANLAIEDNSMQCLQALANHGATLTTGPDIFNMIHDTFISLTVVYCMIVAAHPWTTLALMRYDFATNGMQLQNTVTFAARLLGSIPIVVLGTPAMFCIGLSFTIVTLTLALLTIIFTGQLKECFGCLPNNEAGNFVREYRQTTSGSGLSLTTASLEKADYSGAKITDAHENTSLALTTSNLRKVAVDIEMGSLGQPAALFSADKNSNIQTADLRHEVNRLN